MKTNFFRTILNVIICISILSVFASCSKKDDPEVSPADGRNAKFTFTVTGAPSSAYISFVAAGVGNDPADATVWKINGVTQSSQAAVSLGLNDFTGGTQTYVVESTKPLRAISAGAQCLSPAADRPYTISFKAEINGEVKVNEQNIIVSRDKDFTHNYTF